jgi:hypothetical protein
MDTERLLDNLCVQLGFCLDPDDRKVLIESPPSTVDSFADEVIKREGLDPLTFDSGIRRKVKDVVAEHTEQPLGRISSGRHRR